jgi:TPR repeat protein
MLSQVYQQGLGVASDMERSIRWLVSGAEAGSPVAQASVAELYAVGTSVPRDLPPPP